MLYDLKTPIDRKRAERRFVQLLQEQVIIELAKKEKRSLNQNNYLHLILGWFAIETGYNMTEAKQLYKLQSPEIYCYEKDGYGFLKSSAELTSKEMTVSIEKFRNYSSADAGIYLPEANEQAFLDSIRLELSKNQYI